MGSGRSFKSVAYKLIEGPTVGTPTMLAQTTRLLTCGFEENNLLQTMWDATLVAGNGVVDVQSTVTRSGSYALRCLRPAQTDSATLKRFLHTTFTRVLVRMYLRVDTFPTSAIIPAVLARFTFASGAGQVCELGILQQTLRLDAPTAQSPAVSAVLAAINGQTWYRIELDIRGAVGAPPAAHTVSLYSEFGTVPLASITLQDIATRGVIDQIWLGGSLQGGQDNKLTCYFDDVAFDSAVMPGQARVAIVNPLNDVAVAWVKSVGTRNFANVDDVPGTPDDASGYNSSTSTSAEDRLALQFFQQLGFLQPITFLDLYGRVMALSGVPTMALKAWTPGGTGTPGPTFTPPTGAFAILATDKHAAFTLTNFGRANVEQANIGYVAQSAANEKRISALWGNVEY